MEPRIFVRVSDGLGNQMFQYALGRALSQRTGLALSLDVSWFDPRLKHSTPRRYGLDVFPIQAEIATQQQLKAIAFNETERRFGLVPLSEMVAFFREPSRRYWPQVASINGPAYLRGYWQSPRYFGAFADTVRTHLAPPQPTSPDGRKFAAEIAQAPNAVAVHVRRTDYVNQQWGLERFAGCCPPEYYSAAIDRLAQQFGSLSLFLFSDDPRWVRANFDTRRHAMTVVDVPGHVDAPYFDLYLMTLARHHVIANSTFSWWGAWLKTATDGAVITPRRWYANEGPETAFGTLDRFPADWTVI